jgi:putative sigma-54 modulation protein
VAVWSQEQGVEAVQIKISTRHGTISEETREKVHAKLDKLGRLFERISLIEATVDLEHRDAPAVDVKVYAEHKHDFVATTQAGELLAAVDQVIHKLEQQLRKYKQKIQDHHRTSTPRESEVPTDRGPADEG